MKRKVKNSEMYKTPETYLNRYTRIATEMSTITEAHRAMAKASLAMMAQVYDDVVSSGLSNPPKNGMELIHMLEKAIFQDESSDVICVGVKREEEEEVEMPEPPMSNPPKNTKKNTKKTAKSAETSSDEEPSDAESDVSSLSSGSMLSKKEQKIAMLTDEYNSFAGGEWSRLFPIITKKATYEAGVAPGKVGELTDAIRGIKSAIRKDVKENKSAEMTEMKLEKEDAKSVKWTEAEKKKTAKAQEAAEKKAAKEAAKAEKEAAKTAKSQEAAEKKAAKEEAKAEKEAAKTAKSQEAAEKKAAKEEAKAEKEAAKAAKSQEAAEKKAAKEAAKAAKSQEAAEKKAAKEAAKAAKSQEAAEKEAAKTAKSQEVDEKKAAKEAATEEATEAATEEATEAAKEAATEAATEDTFEKEWETEVEEGSTTPKEEFKQLYTDPMTGADVPYVETPGCKYTTEFDHGDCLELDIWDLVKTEEVEFVKRIYVKSTKKYYGVDEEDMVFELSGEEAPAAYNIDDIDLVGTWDDTEKTIVLD